MLQVKKIEIKFGFGFVEYGDPKDAEDAISKLDGAHIIFWSSGIDVDDGGPVPWFPLTIYSKMMRYGYVGTQVSCSWETG